MKNTIDCAICGGKYKRITRTHLLKHGITTDEYCAIYPNNPIVSEELAYKLGRASREMNTERRAKIGQWAKENMTGKPKSEEHRRKISENRIGKSWGRHTEEHKARMREVGRIEMEKRKSNGWMPHVHTEEERRRISEAVKQARAEKYWRGPANKGKKLNLTEEQRANRSRKASENMNGKNMMNTSLELKMKAYLTDNDLVFDQQFVIESKGAWVYDFYIPSLNLLLEVDGEYWHSSARAINRDKIKEQIARRTGMRFLRISDRDWKPELIHGSDADQIAHNKALIENRQSNLKD